MYCDKILFISCPEKAIQVELGKQKKVNNKA